MDWIIVTLALFLLVLSLWRSTPPKLPEGPFYGPHRRANKQQIALLNRALRSNILDKPLHYPDRPWQFVVLCKYFETKGIALRCERGYPGCVAITMTSLKDQDES